MSSQQNKLKEKRRKKVFLLLFHFLLKTFDNFLQQKNIAKYFLIRFRYFICFDQFDEACVLSNLLFLNSFIFCQQLMGGFESTTYNSMTTNVTRFGQILPLNRKNIKVFVNFWEFIWFLEKFQTYFGKFWSFWIDFHCYEWTDIEKIINQSDLNDLSPTCAYMNHENEHRFVQPKNKLFLPFSLHTF